MKRKTKKPNRLPNYTPPPTRPCPVCGVLAAHFVPPSFGETGFYICQMGSHDDAIQDRL